MADDEELKTFQTEYRKLIGGAIINGLINPKTNFGNVLGTIGGGVRKDYDQINPGNYTQLAGDHDQAGGNYDQH